MVPIHIDAGSIIELVIGTILAAGLIAFFSQSRKIFKLLSLLPRELEIQKAAIFRLLRSNKVQGTALVTTMECQKRGSCNGATDDAIAQVKRDQERIDKYLHNAAIGKIYIEEGNGE